MSQICDYDINNYIQEFLYRNFEKQKKVFEKNKIADKYSVELGNTLNYGKIIVPSNKSNKVTIVGKYTPPQKYAKLYFDEDEKVLKSILVSDDRYYYGVAPTINSTTIINEIKSLSIKSKEGLKNFVCEHASEFMAHENQADCLAELAEYIVVGMLSNF